MWPIKSKTGQQVAERLLTTFSLLGFPRIIQSDNGGEFINDTIEKLKEICGFDHRTITPYYPQANGIAEAQVKTLKSVLFKSILGQSDQWDRALPYVQYSMNSKLHPSHQLTPYMAMFGRKPFPLADHRNQLQSSMQERFEAINDILFP
jgi:transposase InsO family protein